MSCETTSFLHAIENGEPLPIGPQDAEMLDARLYDEDADAQNIISNSFDDEDNAPTDDTGRTTRFPNVN